MEIVLLTGVDIAPHWRELAELRIQVFREYPYLYRGTMKYEEHYLQPYLRSSGSLVILVRDHGRCVGASTGLPLKDTDDVVGTFREHQLPVEDYFYLGESVLLPSYRGQGLGKRFFEEREAHARRLEGYGWTCFCAVERPEDHPARPADYRPREAFWSRMGYQRDPELVAHLSWQDLTEEQESAKPMRFWTKKL